MNKKLLLYGAIGLGLYYLLKKKSTAQTNTPVVPKTTNAGPLTPDFGGYKPTNDFPIRNVNPSNFGEDLRPNNPINDFPIRNVNPDYSNLSQLQDIPTPKIVTRDFIEPYTPPRPENWQGAGNYGPSIYDSYLQ